MKLPPVGCQLLVFSSRYDLNKDTDVVLDAVKAAGYAAVEGCSKDVEGFKRKLDARGLKCGGLHTGLKGLLDPAPFIRNLRTLGAMDLCNSGLMEWNNRSLDDYKTAIRILNEAGRKLADAGMRLHYHNHDFEFAKVDGNRTGMDLLLDGLDPKVVDLCVDVAWVMRGGDDPASYLLAHKDVIGYLHFKDFDGQNWIELGQGKVDFASIMKVLPKLTRARWVMIEQDKTAIDPVDSVRISRSYLRSTFGY